MMDWEMRRGWAGKETDMNTKTTTGSLNNLMGRIVSNVRLPNQLSQVMKMVAAATPPIEGPSIAPLVHENDAPPSWRAKTRGIAQDIESRHPMGSIRRSSARSNEGIGNAGIDAPKMRMAAKLIGALKISSASSFPYTRNRSSEEFKKIEESTGSNSLHPENPSPGTLICNHTSKTGPRRLLSAKAEEMMAE